MITVRRLNEENLNEALENCRLFWKMENSSENLSSFLSNPSCLMLSARVEGKTAGQIMAYILPRWDVKKAVLFIYSVDVLNEYRKLGVGKALVSELNMLGKYSGCSKSFVLTDSCNTGALSLYKSAGGRIVPFSDVMFQWDYS